jgi:hypothetical protein
MMVRFSVFSSRSTLWSPSTDVDYGVFQQRQSESKNSLSIYVKDPSVPLPPQSSYRNPNFYLFRINQNIPVQPTLQDPTLFEIEAIDQLIKKERESLRDVVAAFLKSPGPPLWAPPDHATPSDREFLATLQIPSYSDGRPSLLFHNLHVRDDDEIKKIFGTNNPVYEVIMCPLNPSHHKL